MHRIHDEQLGLVAQPVQQLPPQLDFDPPQVGTLAEKGRAMDIGQGGKPVTVLSLKVEKQPFVGVMP